MNAMKPNLPQDILEPMIDGKQAACALRLPLYWFADQKLRAKYRIPHYLMGGLVRFRMTELSTWAAKSNAVSGPKTEADQPESHDHDGL